MAPRYPERFCCEEDLALIGYDGHEAAENLARLRAAGPRRETQELIDVVLAEGVTGATVLDVGAGVGAVHLALIEAGAARAVDVDASREYIAAARAEADRRGMAGRIDYRFGDLVELAAELPAADVVTLDSVICCYPRLPSLIDAAARVRPRIIGLTYPRDVPWMVAFMRLYNLIHALRRSPARYFIYRRRDVVRLLAEASYVEVHDGGSPPWRVALYRRRDA